ncbi:hypothetical protein MIMGU_mgv1a017145mg [Erythranthe guttata]|uniref:Uncharacterized protein n=1 Tax=Erythranthe guttata TaxID=4155 RepID=A0A022QK28_ERYGU|nr:hypothetical protein MIMGU_mgv1a017145mg [Erythranthe guttata]
MCQNHNPFGRYFCSDASLLHHSNILHLIDENFEKLIEKKTVSYFCVSSFKACRESDRRGTRNEETLQPKRSISSIQCNIGLIGQLGQMELP